MKKPIFYIFLALVCLSLLTPFLVFKDLLFPYITSKAFYFRICIELALPFYIYILLADKSLRPKLKNPLNIAAAAFLVINIAAAFLGVNPPRSLWGNFERMGGVYYLAHLTVLYFYVQAIGQAGSVYLKRFLQAFILAAVLVTLNGLSGWIGGPTLVQDPSLPIRVSSTFGNPIFFPSFLIVPMFFAFYFGLNEESKARKAVYFIAAFLQLLGIYSSATRGAMVGLLIGLFTAVVLYTVLNKNPKLKRYGLIAAAVFVLFFGGLYVFHNKLTPGSRLYRIVNLRDSNTEARLIQWRMALRGFSEHPLLGVGAENYYVISDKYYDPALYQYDASWFDKPHNFLIEVLVTNGILGFAAYVGMFLLALYGLWKAYRAGLLGLMEMCVLAAAIITYQVQNLFVFDTVSASVAFWAFMGFAAYLWHAAQEEASAVLEQGQKPVFESSFMYATLGVACCVMLYVVYISNIVSMQAAKRVNYGFAYTEYDPHKAADYFASALSLAFNLDPRETVNRYSDFTHRLLNMENKNVKIEFITEQVDKATAAQRSITEQVKNDPLLWMRLAIDEMDEAIIHNRSLDAARTAANEAIALAPKRVELLQLNIQIAGYTKNWAAAVSAAEEIVKLSPYNASVRWQLAMAYYLLGRMEDAVAQADKSIEDGFKFSQLQQFAWYIQYYEAKKDWKKVAPLLEQAVNFQPNEIGLYIELAQAYANAGDKDHAIAIARQVEKSDPSRKEAMEKFIQSLH